MTKYTAHFPFIPDMGSMSPLSGLSNKSTETKEEEALWHLNRSRDHDGQKHLKTLPPGTKFTVDRP